MFSALTVGLQRERWRLHTDLKNLQRLLQQNLNLWKWVSISGRCGLKSSIKDLLRRTKEGRWWHHQPTPLTPNKNQSFSQRPPEHQRRRRGVETPKKKTAAGYNFWPEPPAEPEEPSDRIMFGSKSSRIMVRAAFLTLSCWNQAEGKSFNKTNLQTPQTYGGPKKH